MSEARGLAGGSDAGSGADESPYVVPDRLPGGEEAGAAPASGLSGIVDAFRGSRLSGAVDLSTMEMAALTMFRVLFGQGVAIPIRREGIADMDIVVMGKDIVINTNRLVLELPELTIWRVIFTYKGRPILEYGRGVPGRVKVHKVRALLLLVGLWWHGLTSRDAQSDRISNRAAVLITRREEKKKAKKEKSPD